MAERDPFGRLPDENPLEFLGRPSNGTEAAAAEAVAAETAASARPSPARSERTTPAAPQDPNVALLRPRTGGRTSPTTLVDPALVGRMARGIIRSAVVFAVVVLLAVGLLVSSSGTDKSPSGQVQESRQAAPPAPASSSAAPPPPARPAATPRGLNASSMLTRRKLAPALRRLGTSGLGRLYSLSIRPARIDAQLLTRGGRLRPVQLRSDGKLSDFGTSGPGFGQLDTIAFARVQAGAPERLARSAAERLHRSASQVDYVVLLALGSSLSWSVFMRDGKHFLADARGRITRRIS